MPLKVTRLEIPKDIQAAIATGLELGRKAREAKEVRSFRQRLRRWLGRKAKE